MSAARHRLMSHYGRAPTPADQTSSSYVLRLSWQRVAWLAVAVARDKSRSPRLRVAAAAALAHHVQPDLYTLYRKSRCCLTLASTAAYRPPRTQPREREHCAAATIQPWRKSLPRYHNRAAFLCPGIQGHMFMKLGGSAFRVLCFAPGYNKRHGREGELTSR